MSGQELRQLLKARPFKPFKVFLPNDRGFDIPHPEFAWLTPTGRTLFIGRANEDGVEMLEVPLITRVQVGATSSEV